MVYAACRPETRVIAGVSIQLEHKQDKIMAGGHSDYTHGTMKVDAQSGTFSGFMGGTKYGGSAIALIVLMPTLVFAVGMHWLPALVATVILGFVMGMALKLKGGWYVGLVGAAVFTAIVCFALSLFV